MSKAIIATLLKSSSIEKERIGGVDSSNSGVGSPIQIQFYEHLQ